MVNNFMNFDVIIIGAGHAGIEAACASIRIGVKTALITASKNNLGELTFNEDEIKTSIKGLLGGIKFSFIATAIGLFLLLVFTLAFMKFLSLFHFLMQNIY